MVRKPTPRISHPQRCRVRPRRRELSCLITALLATGGLHSANAREVPFTTPPPISTSADGANVVVTVDLDGDGDRDAVSTSGIDDKLAWYENNGAGTSWTTHTIATGLGSPYAVFAADLEGDGDLDLVTGSFDGRVNWFEADGSGSTWTLHTVTTSLDFVRSLAGVDLDGDGDLDIVSGSQNDNTIAWHENTGGDGLAWATHTISTDANGPRAVRPADIDADGDLDVVSASTNDDMVAWHENTVGDGTAWTLHTITTSPDGANSVRAADVDGDGDSDVQVTSLNDQTVAWYENDGVGSTWTEHVINAAAGNPQSIFDADVDGDGDVDALVAASYDTLIWYENDGEGGTWTVHTVTTTADFAIGAHAADVDGDGDTDLLSASFADDTIAWYRNDTIHRSAHFPSRFVISNTVLGVRNVFAGDINGDGFTDVLSASLNEDKIAWYANDGAGRWLLQTISTAVDGAQGLYAADIDGDGDLDVASTAYFGGQIFWHENDGSGGGWTLHTIEADTVSLPGFVSAADVDGDGDIDIFSEYNSTLAWYENDGTGLSWSVHTIPNTIAGPRSVFVADIDGDGDLDALSAVGSNLIAWSENDGSGGFATLHTISATVDNGLSVFAADVDGDGDLDAISASFDDDKIAWYENTSGDGSAWSTITVTTNADGANSVVSADFDNDGDLDIGATAAISDAVTWYENTAGDGSAWATLTDTMPADGARSVFAADVDDDGDVDLLAASFSDATVAWRENRGGQFALPTLDIAQKFVNNSETHDLLYIQALHRGRIGDSNAELVTLQLKLTDDVGVDLTSTEADNLIEELRLHLDDGSGEFEARSDAIVHTVSAFTLTAGVETITFADGNPNAQLRFASPKVYFAVADMTANADSQTPSAFQLTHLTESTSTGEDAVHDIPLILAFFPDTGTGVVDTALSTASCQAPFDLQLADRTVSTTLVCEAGTILSAENFNLTGSADVTFRAGNRVTLRPGFSIQDGQFAVEIDPALTP